MKPVSNALASLLFVLPQLAFAQSLQPVEERVKAITQEACDAMRLGDIAALEELLSEDFTLIGSRADLQSRSDLIADIESGDTHFDVFENHSMKVRLYGDTAVVVGVTTLAGSAGGRDFALDVRFTDTLVRIDGRWRLVASHVTEIPASG